MYVVVETWTLKPAYFEQSNVVGELRPAEAVAAEHLALGAEAK
ncbi:hypothetical protein [Streptomyces hokutonensis]